MNPAAKKKVLDSNKAQSPIEKLGIDFQFRSSTELAKLLKIKKENLTNGREYQAPINVKRKNPMPPILNTREGQSRQRFIQSEESFQQEGNDKLPIPKSTIQLPSKKVLSTPHVIRRREGEEEKQLDINELQNVKKVKRKSVLSANSLDFFLQQKETVHVVGEKQPDIQQVNASKSMSSPPIDEHNIELDNFDAQKEVGEDECVRDEAMDIDSHTDGISNKKKVRGQTKCKFIHARNLGEREEVTFYDGQAVGPTGKRVSQLSSFLGTIARNPRFVTLLFTSWHAVPQDAKQRMWNYVKTKFIIPTEGKKWVMDGIRNAWRQHKSCTKKNKFDVNRTVEEMLKDRPTGIPEDHFRQLIEYWKDKDVQARSKLNSENRKKQKWRHRMGPISFARVRMALRATKENNEEPSKSEMFIATRTKTGKQVHEDSQIAISELQNHQNSGETADEAFRAVFGKEQPGRIRCYGRSVTASSLKKNEEINKLQQKHNSEVSTLKEEIQEMRNEMQNLRQLRQCFNLLLQNNPGLNIQHIPGFVGSNQPSPVDGASSHGVRDRNLPHSSGSTHGLEKENLDDAIGNGGRKSI